MKIGVAFSGCGDSALGAWAFADELEKYSLKIDLLSVTSLSAISSLLWSYGQEEGQIRKYMAGLMKSPSWEELDFTLAPKEKGYRCPLAVNSVDVLTGVSVIYCDQLHSDAWKLKTYPLAGRERQALLSTLSPYKGLEPLCLDDMLLCDFSVQYGCPCFPLKMAGVEKILSVSLCGGYQPVQVAADSLSLLTGKNSDLHYSLPAPKRKRIARIEEANRQFVREHISEIYEKLLF